MIWQRKCIWQHFYTPMELLDDDSLICVFNELEFLQKIPLELVCKRWNRILRSHASYSKMQSVNIADYVNEQKQQQNANGNDCDENYNYKATISGIIARVGPHMRELDFGQRWPRIPQSIISQLSQKCKNLTKIDMGWVRLEADISPLLEQIGTQLVDFSLEESNWANSENAAKVSYYLPKMKLLKRLNLRKFDEALDELALLNSGTMEFLDVSECTQLSADILVQFFEHNPQLLVLHLCPMPFSCLPLIAMSTTSSINLPGPFLGFIRPQKQTKRQYTDDGKLIRKAKNKHKNGIDLQILINKLAKLKCLRTFWLGHIPYSAHFLSLKALAELREIRHLHVKECNSLDGNALDIILNGISPTLRQLSLFNCGQLENFGALSNCQTLSQIDIEKGNCLKNADLSDLAMHGKVRILRLKECPGITDQSVRFVIEHCPMLKEMELIKCNGISDKLFSNGQTFPKLQNLERFSLSGCEAISRQSILEAIDVLNWDLLTQLDLSKNMNIDQSILLPIYEKLKAQKQTRNNKCLTLNVGGTGITRENDQIKWEAQIELMF